MFLAFLGIQDPTTVAVVVAAITALATSILTTPVRLWADARLLRKKADTEYEYEQRKQLREQIGAYRGRVLSAAMGLNDRLGNLTLNHDRHWLDVNAQYDHPQTWSYYFRTTIARFMQLMTLIDCFAREAIYIDARYAEAKDQRFVTYVSAIRRAMTDAELFAETGYDAGSDTDHFFRDALGHMCSVLTSSDGRPDLARLDTVLASSDTLDPVLRFFDDASRGSLRWDRLFSLDLLLLAFLNELGNSTQRSDHVWFERAAAEIQHDQIAVNMLRWLPTLGLEKGSEPARVRRVLERRVARGAQARD